MKVADKALDSKAKQEARADRVEEMDYFSAYYKEKFAGWKLFPFKKFCDHPWRI